MIPHAQKLGLRLSDQQGESLIIEMPYKAEQEAVSGSGIVANGAITTLLDTALGAAVYDQFETFRRIVTLDLRVDYFEKPQPFSTIVVKTRCLKVTDQMVFVQGDAYSGEGSSPIAHGIAVFSYAEMETNK
ncbi:MAG: hypothetical protein COB49_05820 [Alphaproteobacteria bacterium]|nr:MAG: hypothetical protein COB49_05820 [Alphaproteobacteria bacterium]